jgi:uncharacterized protein
MVYTASYWIEKLQMQAHPEGGYFKETYRSKGIIAQTALPAHFSGDRNYATGIYFLLQGDDFSAFHKIQSDEMWHFYAGTGLEIVSIDSQGNLTTYLLGNDGEQGQSFQALIPAGVWFGSRVITQTSYALVGCTVAPGFDFQDFELAKRAELIAQFPQHANIIEELTRIA